MNTTNNIRVDPGSKVGQINAGALIYLDHAVSVFSDAGNRELAAELQAFVQQIVYSKGCDGGYTKRNS